MGRTGAAGGLHGCVRDRHWEAITVRCASRIRARLSLMSVSQLTQSVQTPAWADGAAPWVVVRDVDGVPTV